MIFKIKILLFIAFISYFVLGQERIPKEIIVEKNKPSVYLTFEKEGEYCPLCVGKSEDGVLLKLHNNTPWAILLDGNTVKENENYLITLADETKVSAVVDGTEIKTCFSIEQEPLLLPRKKGNSIILNSPIDVSIPEIPILCNCKWRTERISTRKGVWLASKDSVLFSVPKSALKKYLKVYTVFHYEWETSEGKLKTDEPQHQVYFHTADLPSDIK